MTEELTELNSATRKYINRPKVTIEGLRTASHVIDQRLGFHDDVNHAPRLLFQIPNLDAVHRSSEGLSAIV